MMISIKFETRDQTCSKIEKNWFLLINCGRKHKTWIL